MGPTDNDEDDDADDDDGDIAHSKNASRVSCE